MGYKSKYLLITGDKGQLKGYEASKIINAAKSKSEAADFWKWAWVPIFIAFILVVIMLLPK